ncbi:MAG: radical SAM protein [Syntrophobacterales bacterium]|nr:radical SAM protein [Syntrophobacterales bacterium]
MFWLPFLSRPPRFDWLQVEITTACTAACIYCPRTVFREAWPELSLDRETFARLAPIFPGARYVHLQGWGEPFLHPDFFLFLREAKKAGCQVGATTNGMLATEAVLERCVAEGLDVLAFSLAGTDPGQDEIRRGTRLEQVLEALKTLARLKAARGASTPRVHVAYMLLASRLGDLARLPRLLSGLGVAQVVISTLDFVAAPELAPEVVEDSPVLAATLARLRREAGARGLEVHDRWSAPPGRVGPCSENPLRALVVAADGAVSPCVFAALPPGGGGGGPVAHRLSFGNLREQDLMAIWDSPAYREFRRALSAGSPPPVCRSCRKRSHP